MFLSSSIIFAFLVGSQRSLAETTSFGNEEVIASVECVVKDPGTLNSYLGIKKGSIIRIETLSSYVSSLILDRDVLITGFPAVLNFDARRKAFNFSGATSDSLEGSTVSLNVEGSLAERGEASFIFNLMDQDFDVSGIARLKRCIRIN